MHVFANLPFSIKSAYQTRVYCSRTTLTQALNPNQGVNGAQNRKVSSHVHLLDAFSAPSNLGDYSSKSFRKNITVLQY
jgi:hypothetical protein